MGTLLVELKFCIHVHPAGEVVDIPSTKSIFCMPSVYNWTSFGVVGAQLSQPVEDQMSDISVIVICSVLGFLLSAIFIFILVRCCLHEKERYIKIQHCNKIESSK